MAKPSKIVAGHPTFVIPAFIPVIPAQAGIHLSAIHDGFPLSRE